MTFIPSPDDAPVNPLKPVQFSRLDWICKIALAAIFIYFIVYHIHHERRDTGHLGDFRTFYQAGEFARSHRDIYTAGPNSSQMYVYPPLIAFLCAPLSRLPILAAAHIWLVCNALMLLISVLLGTRVMLNRLGMLNSTSAWLAALLAALLSENELRAVLTMLETDPIMLLMFTLAIYWLDKRPVLAGMALALAMNIKYLPIVALPYLIVRRRWVVLLAMVVGSVFFALLPAILLGWREDLRCLHVSLGGLLRWVGVSPEQTHAIRVHDIADSLSISITSMLARVLEPRGFSNLGILSLTAALGLLLVLGVQLMYQGNGFVLLKWPDALGQRQPVFQALVGIEWAGLVTIALVFSPDTNTRHLVLAVLVNALAAALIVGRWTHARKLFAWIGAAIILLGFIMPFGTKGSRVHEFYFRYSVPGWCLLAGYLLILWSALRSTADRARLHAPRAP